MYWLYGSLKLGFVDEAASLLGATVCTPRAWNWASLANKLFKLVSSTCRDWISLARMHNWCCKSNFGPLLKLASQAEILRPISCHIILWALCEFLCLRVDIGKAVFTILLVDGDAFDLEHRIFQSGICYRIIFQSKLWSIFVKETLHIAFNHFVNMNIVSMALERFTVTSELWLKVGTCFGLCCRITVVLIINISCSRVLKIRSGCLVFEETRLEAAIKVCIHLMIRIDHWLGLIKPRPPILRLEFGSHWFNLALKLVVIFFPWSHLTILLRCHQKGPGMLPLARHIGVVDTHFGSYRHH